MPHVTTQLLHAHHSSAEQPVLCASLLCLVVNELVGKLILDIFSSAVLMMLSCFLLNIFVQLV